MALFSFLIRRFPRASDLAEDKDIKQESDLMQYKVNGTDTNNK